MSNIDVVRKNLGHVTAYKYAVSKGFQGTEEEFAELMASYASIAQDVSAESRVAEGYALGKQNGVDVGDQSPYYHANAKYHAEQAAASASAAAASAQSLVIDGTLSQEGQAADAKAVGDEITELKSALNDATGCTVIQLSDQSLHQYIQTNGGVGTVVQWDTPFTMGNAGAWAVVDCVEGDKFTISGKGGDADRLWCFLDAEKKITRVAGSGTTSTNHILTARTDEVYLVINNRQDKTSYIGEIIPKTIDDINMRLDNALELDNAHAITLSSDSQVDSLTPGTYIVPNSTVATSLNLPRAGGGKIYHLLLHSSQREAQIFIYTTEVYIRYFNGTNWSDWVKLADNGILNDIVRYDVDQTKTSTEKLRARNNIGVTDELASKFELDNQKSTAITTSTDIDNLPIGNYFVSASATASTLNLPFGTPGRLYVLSMQSSARFLQIFLTTTNIAIRYWNGTTWSNWKYITNDGISSTDYVLATSTSPTPFNDFNNAPDNGIYAINRAQYTNAPPGDNTLFNENAKPGYLRGTLLTYTQSILNPSYKVQVFVGYYSAIIDTPPIMAYRFAIKNSSQVYDWSPWGKMSAPYSLHTSNVVIHASYASNYFTDFDDAPINTMYQIDLDCVDGVIAHHPAPGYSAVLHTFAWSSTSRHALVQKLYSLQSGILIEYTRYGYQNATDDYRWTPWRKNVTEAVT